MELSRIDAGLVDAALPQPVADPIIVAALDDEEAKAPQAQAAQVPNLGLNIELEPDCAVCMQIMVTPVELPCKHVFCKGCCHATLGFKWECPMCRYVPPGNFKCVVSQQLLEQIKAMADPEQFAERMLKVGPQASPKNLGKNA